MSFAGLRLLPARREAERSGLEYIRTDRNGTEIYHDWNCPRCGGAGQSDNWWRTGKTCYECGGTGRRIKPAIVKKYTPEHEAVLAEKAHKRFLKRQAEENAAFFRKNGFAEDGTGYVFTGDTYDIKDELKAAGARWNNFLRWIAPQPIGSYPCLKVDAREVSEFGEVYHLVYEKCIAFCEAHGIFGYGTEERT